MNSSHAEEPEVPAKQIVRGTRNNYAKGDCLVKMQDALSEAFKKPEEKISIVTANHGKSLSERLSGKLRLEAGSGRAKYLTDLEEKLLADFLI